MRLDRDVAVMGQVDHEQMEDSSESEGNHFPTEGIEEEEQIPGHDLSEERHMTQEPLQSNSEVSPLPLPAAPEQPNRRGSCSEVSPLLVPAAPALDTTSAPASRSMQGSAPSNTIAPGALDVRASAPNPLLERNDRQSLPCPCASDTGTSQSCGVCDNGMPFRHGPRIYEKVSSEPLFQPPADTGARAGDFFLNRTVNSLTPRMWVMRDGEWMLVPGAHFCS